MTRCHARLRGWTVFPTNIYLSFPWEFLPKIIMTNSRIRFSPRRILYNIRPTAVIWLSSANTELLHLPIYVSYLLEPVYALRFSSPMWFWSCERMSPPQVQYPFDRQSYRRRELNFWRWTYSIHLNVYTTFEKKSNSLGHFACDWEGLPRFFNTVIVKRNWMHRLMLSRFWFVCGLNTF